MITALVATMLLAQFPGDPESRLFQGEGRVDPAPYAEALQTRFFSCLAVEGARIPHQQAQIVRQSLREVSSLLARRGVGGDCTTSPAVLAQCVGQVRLMSCAELQQQVMGSVRGAFGNRTPPAWAAQYATALTDKVRTCYAAEARRPLYPSETRDFQTFQDFLGLGFGALQGVCTLRRPEFNICLAVVRGITCVELVDLLSANPAALVQRMMQNCRGFLDCGYDP